MCAIITCTTSATAVLLPLLWQLLVRSSVSLPALTLPFSALSLLPVLYVTMTHMTSSQGNPHMIYPSLEVLAAGLDSVRTWCKRRFADRIHARRNTIVLTVQVQLLCVLYSYLLHGAAKR
jgi:hypothetical protein